MKSLQMQVRVLSCCGKTGQASSPFVSMSFAEWLICSKWMPQFTVQLLPGQSNHKSDLCPVSVTEGPYHAVACIMTSLEMVVAAMPERKNSIKTGGAANRRNGTTRKRRLMREVMEMHLSFLFLHMGVLQHWSSLCHCFTKVFFTKVFLVFYFVCVRVCVCCFVLFLPCGWLTLGVCCSKPLKVLQHRKTW